MATVWECVGQLEGQILRTKTGKPFQVVSVDRQYVTVEPERTGTPRRIRRSEVEAAYDLHLSTEELTASRLVKEQVTGFNPVYIVSILKSIEGVLQHETTQNLRMSLQPEQKGAEEFISQLERISRLHQDGVLSNRDFAQAKLKLLKITE